jgi:tRNA(Ile)-lysidine synthase
MDLDIDRLFTGLDLADRRSLVVAVSGGSDSLSLLFLTHAYLSAHAPHVRLLAATVDHGLRPEAAGEASAVQQLCHSCGIDHRTLLWQGEKPKSGLIAAAREARYELLAHAAEEFGADIILVGHTMDDQAETVAMRAERGAGSGLAGMARTMLFDDRVWIVRPLLGVRRTALRRWLTRRNLEWIDDPSNENPAFERVRMRAQLAESGNVEVIAEQADRAGLARRALSADAAALICRHTQMPSPGLFRADAELLGEPSGSDEATLLAIRGLLALAGGTSHLPDVDRSRELLSIVRAGPARVALSRTVIERRGGALWLMRERRGVASISASDAKDIWDGRWQVRGLDGDVTLRLCATGPRPAQRDAPSPGSPPRGLVSAALALEPALFERENFVGAADSQEARNRFIHARPIVAPFARFLPDFDLALAGALAALRQARVPPPSPWKDHIEEGP